MIKKQLVCNKTSVNPILVGFAAAYSFPIILFSISFLVNLIVLIDYLHSPFSYGLLWDAQSYWEQAKIISQGNWLGSSIYYQAPLYVYFLAIVIKVSGGSLLPVYTIQIIFSAFSTVLIGLITTRIANKKVGFVAGIFYAFYGMQVFYSLKILSETLAIVLMLSTIWLLLLRTNLKGMVFTGVLFGLLTVAKPNLILIVPFILVFLFLEHRQFKKSIPTIIAFCVPVVFLVSSVALRNYIVEKDFVLLSSNGGENFFIGNNEKANGTYKKIDGIVPDIKYQQKDVTAVAQSNFNHKLKPSEVSGYWLHQGTSFILSHPVQYFNLLLQKARFIFSGAERTTMYFLGFEKTVLTKTLHIPFMNFYIFLPFFIAGVLVTLKFWRKYLLFYIFLIGNIGNMLLFFYDTRFMLLAMPIWIIFAAIGCTHVWNLFTTNRSISVLKQTVVIVFIVSIFCTVYVYRSDAHAKSPESFMYMALGDIYFLHKNYNESMNAYTKSIELSPRNWMPVMGLSVVSWAMGEKEESAKLYISAFNNISVDRQTLVLRDTLYNNIREFIAFKKQP